MNKTDIGNFINSLRTEKGLTQKQLAEMLNVTDKAVSRWETGKNYPDIEMFEKIAEVFNVSVSELLEGRKISPENIAEVSENQVVEQIRSNKKSKRKYSVIIAAALTVSIILGTCLLRQCGVFSEVKYRKIDVFTGDTVTVLNNIDGYITQQPKAEGNFIVDECRIFLDENKITNDLYLSGTNENGRKFFVSTIYNKTKPEKSFIFSDGTLKKLNIQPPKGFYSFVELGIFHNGEIETVAEILCKID